jgi:hypothetical protein
MNDNITDEYYNNFIDNLGEINDIFDELNVEVKEDLMDELSIYTINENRTGLTNYTINENKTELTNEILPLVDICFLSGSNVKTDQGLVAIENIDKSIHTIRGKKIFCLTKTKILGKYLIKIKKGALCNNVPDKDTIISGNHKIFYKSVMIPAKKLVNIVNGVEKILYNNEILYNILLEKYDIMIVNNMITETLHPGNIVSIINILKISENEKINIIKKLNKIIIENDFLKYKKFYQKNISLKFL